MADHFYNLLAQWSSENLGTGLFYFISFLAIPLAFGMLFDYRIIRCGFLLIGVFGTISGLFLLLQAQFLAMAQLMIYAVGITLVVVIALMLTNPRLEVEASTAVPTHKLPGVLVAFGVFLTIYISLRTEIWQSHTAHHVVLDPADNVLQIGKSLIGYYSLPFEFASVLLFIALVGAVMLARADHSKPETYDVVESDEQFERSEADVAKV